MEIPKQNSEDEQYNITILHYSKEKQTIYCRLPCVDTGTLRCVFDVLSMKAQ